MTSVGRLLPCWVALVALFRVSSLMLARREDSALSSSWDFRERWLLPSNHMAACFLLGDEVRGRAEGDSAARQTHSCRKFCCGPITEPGLQIRIQEMASAAVKQ